MQLVADRFAVEDDGRAVDLATGALVTLTVGSAGGVTEQLRWAIRCDRLRTLHHQAIAPLLDFGALGETSRLEAWCCGPPWTGAPEAAQAAYDVASHFLQAEGLSAGSDAPASLRVGGSGAVLILPDADAGYPNDGDVPPSSDMPLHLRGVSVIHRPASAALAEMFDPARGSRPHVSALWGTRGSGKTLVVHELARMARLRGLIPIASRLIHQRYADLWRDRSLFIIDDGGEGYAWPGLLEAALRSSQPHVLLLVGTEEQRAFDGIGLERVGVDALVAAVRPRELNARLADSARRAAERSEGLPGRFVRLLSAGRGVQSAAAAPARRSSAVRVAERPAVYGVPDQTPLSPASPRAWPAPGELTALRRRLDGALAHLAAGRHAPGVRQLRQAIGGLARRDDWTDAAGGAVVLVSSLLRRGRVRAAQTAMEDARQYASRAGRDPLLLDIATLSGEAWIDLARLDEAESVLGAALAAARAARDPVRVVTAAMALARCLFWRGRYADADAALGSVPDDAPDAVRARHSLLSARVAVGQRDAGRALSLVSEVCQRSRADGDARLTAGAACTAAFVHLTVGDLDAVERDAAESIGAARAAHDPLQAVRARLLQAEAERRRGRSAAAAVHLQRLRRIMPTMPVTLRARWELSRALTATGAEQAEILARHVAATGLGALALYAVDQRTAEVGADPILEEMVAILRVCQTAEDETVVLKDVCARVRQQLHATAVAFVIAGGGRSGVVIGDGGRLDTEVAERAIAAGVTIAPHRHDCRIDAAAPVQYGGVPIGALCARWTLGSTYDLSRAGVVLTVSAAAAAPILSAALARREHLYAAATGDLLGVTPAMAELRRNVDRAAAAPFTVLIDGESGSGKELVARAIHRGSPRRDRAFCTLNCAALPDDLVEAELFGHVRGSFSGAIADRSGVFEEAHGGTLFLDEIGELSPRAQAKILRVIQEGELRRVGENVSRRIDVRVVSATNRNLRQEADAGRFRLDLLYRLDVIRIGVPALRDRREDIPVLAEHFWSESTRRLGSRATLGAATMAALARYDWPGNVRELQNVLAALAVRSPKRGVVPPEALPAPFSESRRGEAWRLDDARRTFEERFVRAALVRSGGHRGRAAGELGVTRQGLTKLMTRLGIADEPATGSGVTNDH
jgi:DNA-binding NtrC family response regulator